MKVKEKRVEQIELFNDLIYVYAISRLTLLVEEPEAGIILPVAFFHYFVSCFVVLQAWLYLTNYVNRYGQWRWYEYALTFANMTAAIYLANTIDGDWARMAPAFNLAMLAMLLSVSALYAIQVVLKEQETGAAKNSLEILGISMALYLAAYVASVGGFGWAVMWIDVAAVLTGAFLPFFLRGRFDASIISFPHLVERFELISIISFGEAVVGITGFFDVERFSLEPILVFATILALFGCYVTQIHRLCNHHQTARALRLMFSHYFIVIAVNLVTVAFKFLDSVDGSSVFAAGLMTGALALFFVSLYSNSIYYHAGLAFTGRDGLICALSLAAGALAMYLGCGSPLMFSLGTLLAAGGNLALLLRKEMKQRVQPGRLG